MREQLKGLTIIKRLSMAFGLIIVLLISIATYSQVMMYRLNGLYMYNYSFVMERRRLVSEFENAFEQFRRAINTIIIYEDLGEERSAAILANNVDAISRSVAIMQSSTAEYIDLLNRDEHIERNVQVLNLATMGAMQMSVDNLFRIFSQNMQFGSRPIDMQRNTIDINLRLIEENIEVLRPRLQVEADGLRSEIEGIITAYSTITVAVIILAIVAATMAAYLAINYINKRIKYSQEHVKRIKQGQLERLNDSGDEIASMVNEMMSVLQVIMSEINNVAMASENGDVETEIDITKFEGAYKTTAEGVNRLINQIRESHNDKLRSDLIERNAITKGRFLARVSHEIRTPITAVLGISEIQLQQTDLSLEMEESFAKIYSSAHFLLGIVNDILDMSRIEEGKMEIINQPYRVADLIGDAIQVNLMYIDSRPIGFKLKIDENIPKRLMGDEVRIKQIIINILSNAFKYTEEGMILFVVSYEPRESNMVDLKISIKDTGRGMSSDQLTTLFDEYARFHEEEDVYTKGTGLGMPITYSLIKSMGGTIDIDSKIGMGTIVDISIPQEMLTPERLGREDAKLLQEFKINSAKLIERSAIKPVAMPEGRVLVVDDVEANLYVARGLMNLYQIEVTLSKNGQEAIKHIEAGNEYDLILMDQMMPDMTGYEATTRIREMGYTKPIIAFTANAIVGRSDKYLEEGYDGFLSKPIQAPHLNAILTKFVQHKGKGRYTSDGEESTEDEAYDYLRSPEMVAAVREELVEDYSNAPERIVQAIAEGNFYNGKLLSHTIKTLAAMINQTQLSELAEHIENHLRVEQIPTQDELGEFKKVFDEVVSGLLVK